MYRKKYMYSSRHVMISFTDINSVYFVVVSSFRKLGWPPNFSGFEVVTLYCGTRFYTGSLV